MYSPVKNLYVKTTLSHNRLGPNPISSKFQTWDVRGWGSLRCLGTFFWWRGIVGYWIEVLGLIVDDNDVLFEFRLVQRFRISSIASSLSCSLIYLYIWGILLNIIHAILGSLLFSLLFLMIDNFTDPVLLFFLWISWPLSLLLTQFITEWVYLDDELAMISLVDYCVLTDFMTRCS